ncbi:hypothetical protein B296_00040256 [Ensete ventricosum]|uniref:Uncharacterized protein n=1 Tax=Ensete ventricosum TaxID=4639 RepID=A0A426WY17_ENSVE|nr:hypothetical protein B296_00040256 [Ensete ventricosum]
MSRCSMFRIRTLTILWNGHQTLSSLACVTFHRKGSKWLPLSLGTRHPSKRKVFLH